MIFSDVLLIDATPAEVWALLVDVDRFSACIPGVERVTRVDDRTFDGTILAAVGPMSGNFTFRASIVEAQPTRTLAARVLGTDSVTRSTINADLMMTLSPLAAAQTELTYQTTVDVQGRLAILGDMVLRATATMMLREFAARLRRQLALARET